MSTTTLKTRITNLLPTNASFKSVTVKQLVSRLNRSTTNAPVANATVRGRLSELVAAGVAERETRNSGVTGFYRAS